MGYDIGAEAVRNDRNPCVRIVVANDPYLVLDVAQGLSPKIGYRGEKFQKIEAPIVRGLGDKSMLFESFPDLSLPKCEICRGPR